MLKLLSVVGARPNFMKIASVVEELRQFPEIQHCLVHTGQHYDELLSGNFFTELALPRPDVNLQVGAGSHAVQTAEVIRRLEPVLQDFQPTMVLVVGDVNSTIATALTAVKLGIRVAHIEAGLRSFDMAMPEEINRKLTDAISDLLFVTEQSGLDNLRREGIPEQRMFLVGNVMIDTLLRYRKVAAQSSILTRLGLRSNGLCQPYGVLTLHRPSNVDDQATLEGILTAVGTIAADFPVLFPVHPRTRKNIESFGLSHHLTGSPAASERGIVPLDPLGYIDFLSLNDQARLVFTDSGGIQEETTVLGVPCLTLRQNTERPATIEHGSNHMAGIDPARIVETARSVLVGPPRKTRVPPLWDGMAAARIVTILREQLQSAG
ncbi:MAG TPA: UDP-N-acetylglucosamine 2-epimerase (non-hydrolyzing) [Terriglobales bacterium]|nr:UDP-N-acetylglucosamine 2-epimerase (non-hydrolyzing) [Terriglobales bacterium]